jgi:hypothetical protein
MTPLLTIILTSIVERPVPYMDSFLRALSAWNADALDKIQIIIVKQEKDDPLPGLMLLPHRDLPITIFEAQHDSVEDHAIWDTLAEWRGLWPLVKGRWVTAAHPEYIWLKDRLGKTIAYLEENQPKIALGNLRRLDYTFNGIKPSRYADDGMAVTKKLIKEFNPANFETVASSQWNCWLGKYVSFGKDVEWTEDVFFADKAWLDSWHFLDHNDHMPFQDVYDVMGAVMALTKFKPVMRMPLNINKIIHLSHDKACYWVTPPVRDYFLQHPKWQGTPFADEKLWNDLIERDKNRNYVTVDFRFKEGGTVIRYKDAFNKWLEQGGTL